jgi:hypothetical protein
MANKLEKLPPSQGGGGGGSGGGGGGIGGGSGSGTLPPPDSPCFAAIEQQLYLLWPGRSITLVTRSDGTSYFRITRPGDWVYEVTGTCVNGYVSLNYYSDQTTGVGVG